MCLDVATSDRKSLLSVSYTTIVWGSRLFESSRWQRGAYREPLAQVRKLGAGLGWCVRAPVMTTRRRPSRHLDFPFSGRASSELDGQDKTSF
jgi:hypothetical protein